MELCWPSVADGGITLFHNWANVLCYPGSNLKGDEASVHPYGSQSKHGTITQFCFNVGPASNMIDGIDTNLSVNITARSWSEKDTRHNLDVG